MKKLKSPTIGKSKKLFIAVSLIFISCSKNDSTPVAPLPIASFLWNTVNTTAPSTVIFNNTSTNATSYNWNFGDGKISTVASPTHVYSTVGTFTVGLTAISNTGTSIASTSITTVSAYVVGQSYGGGIVFYVDSTGQHGLIAAPQDQNIGIAWYNGTFLSSNNLGTAIGTGKVNTTNIILLQGAGNYAASVCLNLRLGGYSDWYLPSKDELSLMYGKWTIIGGFYNSYYWSSSDLGSVSISAAWAIDFTNGTVDGHDKARTNVRVRAIRNF